MMVINDYIKRHAETLQDWEINAIRVVQGCIILGMLFLYNYMLKMRKKYYKEQSKGKEIEGGDAKEGRSRSPRSKRD